MARTNDLGQPVGEPVPHWTARQVPPRTPMVGTYCRLEPIDVGRHAGDLYTAYGDDVEGRNWTYLPIGPFPDIDTYAAWLTKAADGDDPLFHAIVDAKSSRALGVAAFMRIDAPNGVVEVGHINYSPRLQGTTAATEAMYLMMRRVFDELGYRRYEWKCDALNAPSRSAAERLGFTFEGVFRQAVVYKGRNRDTAWFSVLDAEWPAVRGAFESWLAPENFDAFGRQRRKLIDLRTPTATGA